MKVRIVLIALAVLSLAKTMYGTNEILRHSSFKLLDSQVRLLSSQSVAITYRVDVNAHCGEQQISEELFASSVWVKHGKQWLTEVHTETVAAPKK